jgi:ATP-dependent helicase/nuclease subunit A
LEAPIVFLPDIGGAPNGRHDPKWLRLASPNSTTPPLYVWGGPAAGDCQEAAKARAVVREAAAGEHRRLLYVAMTRAAQRLVIAGFEGARASPPEAWANLIALGLTAHFREVPSWWDAGERMLRLGEGAQSETPSAALLPLAPLAPPDWLTSPARKEFVYAPLSPSRRLAGNVGAERLSRIEEGRLAHRLLQSLPGLSPERRRGAAETFLARHGAVLSEARRQALIDRAMALIELPEAAPLFGPGSRTEVPIAASLARASGERVTISARIDRLAVTPHQIWIADFKSGPAVARAEHVRQLALYRAAVHPMFPGAEIRAFLLWLDSGRLEELGSHSLDEAYEHWSLDL